MQGNDAGNLDRPKEAAQCFLGEKVTVFNLREEKKLYAEVSKTYVL